MNNNEDNEIFNYPNEYEEIKEQFEPNINEQYDELLKGFDYSCANTILIQLNNLLEDKENESD